MKKISLYLSILTLGLTVGYSNSFASKDENIRKATKVTIETVYSHHFEAGKPTCLYSPRGRRIGSSSNPREGNVALEFDVKIQDGDVIKYLYQGWRKKDGKPSRTFSYENKPENKKGEYSTMINGLSKKNPKDIFYKVKIIDWEGNTEEFKFSLDDLLKDAKPMKTKPMKMVDGELECDRTFD